MVRTAKTTSNLVPLNRFWVTLIVFCPNLVHSIVKMGIHGPKIEILGFPRFLLAAVRMFREHRKGRRGLIPLHSPKLREASVNVNSFALAPVVPVPLHRQRQ